MNSIKPKLTIVVPCYNEALNIPYLLERFDQALVLDNENSKKIYREDIVLILVDNGSTDDTAYVFSNLLPRYPFAQQISVSNNLGYGNGIFQGLLASKTPFLGWTHADLQTDPFDVVRAYEALLNGSSPATCFVKGRRTGRHFADTFFTLGMSIIETIVFTVFLEDINAQPNIFHRSLIDLAPNPPNDFSFDLYYYVLARKLGFTIKRFPVTFDRRLFGDSHWNINWHSKVRFILRTLKYSYNLSNYLRLNKYAIQELKAKIHQ